MATLTNPLSNSASRRLVRLVSTERHILWIIVWVAGMGLFWGWAKIFLNSLGFLELQLAFLNSMIGGVMVIVFSLGLGWASGVCLYALERSGNKTAYLTLNFLLNIVRSVPQIVGILLGYVVVTRLMLGGAFQTPLQQILVTAFLISLVVFLEVSDMIRERIAYHRGLDFYDAMLCCGIPEWRIVNVEILRKNSLAHLVQKAVAVFGMAIFLQCSIDFIVSVGLTMEVSSTNFPVTLGSLLARMDSKQDILAISTVFADITYVKHLFIRHLQGIGVAWTIVYTLFCNYKIANGLVSHYRL
jgi:ABC-type methionine transport system permease subunit